MKFLRTFRSKSYKAWYLNLSPKEKRVIDARVDIFRIDGRLLKSKQLDSKYSLYEFKWDNGLRVYFSLLKDSEGNFMLLLIGGNKNSQSKDITEAKNLILKAFESIKYKEEGLIND